MYVELEQTEVHFIPSGSYPISYYDGGWLVFFSIIHPASLYGSVYVRCRPREGRFTATIAPRSSVVSFILQNRPVQKHYKLLKDTSCLFSLLGYLMVLFQL
jgi:hypothetical protein